VHFGTNKGSHFFSNKVKHSGHGYNIFYEKYFKENRIKHLNIMEFGIHHGDSLAALSSYFPNANVVGVDRNPFSTNYKSERIRTLHCDVSSEKNLINLSNYLNNKGLKIFGPFSADTIFLKQNRKKYDVIIGMYHDQVLAPFKSLYEYDAINLTLGLPFFRVSPDHGPNKEMLGKNLSNPLSLTQSIKFLDKK